MFILSIFSRNFFKILLCIFVWLAIMQTSFAQDTFLLPGIYHYAGVEPINGEMPKYVDSIPKYAYVTYNSDDNGDKRNKVIFLSDFLVSNVQKNKCQAYTNIRKSKQFCLITSSNQNITIENNQSFLFDYNDRLRGKFNLITLKSYMDSLYVANQLTAYHDMNDKNDHFLIGQGAYLAILSKKPDWYEIEVISPEGKVKHGWVNRDDFLITPWILQKPSIDKFLFKVALYRGTTDQNDTQIAVKIINKQTGNIIQTLRDITTDVGYDIGSPNISFIDISKNEDIDWQNFLTDEDVNFDGYPDIRVKGLSGGAKGNTVDSFFIYNPLTNLFDWNKDLSEQIGVEIHPKDQTITSSFAGDMATADFFSEDTFKFINGKLICIKSYKEKIKDDMTIDITKILVDGVWKEHIVTHKTDEDSDAK